MASATSGHLAKETSGETEEATTIGRQTAVRVLVASGRETILL